MTTSRTGTAKWKNTRVRLLAQIRAAGTPCPECGRPYVWDISKDPRSPEIDHIRPYVQGGSDNRDNLRVCCRECNQSLGGKVGRRHRTRTTAEAVQRQPVASSPIW